MASSKIDVDATIGKAKEVALSAYARAEEEGLFSHFGDFNEDLITPVKGIMTDQNLAAAPTYKDKALYLLDQAKTELVKTFSLQEQLFLQPGSSQQIVEECKARYILYNTVGFWLGVLEAVITGLFGNGWLSILFNGVLAYMIAYLCFWCICCAAKPKYMFWALAFICLYTAFCLGMGWAFFFPLILPGILYYAKGFCCVLLGINGYFIYREAYTGDSFVPPGAAPCLEAGGGGASMM